MCMYERKTHTYNFSFFIMINVFWFLILHFVGIFFAKNKAKQNKRRVIYEIYVILQFTYENNDDSSILGSRIIPMHAWKVFLHSNWKLAFSISGF